VRGRWGRRVTAVVGGAGVGKSTLLAQAVAENALDPQGLDVWVRCVPADAAASHLGAALSEALGVDVPAAEDPEGIARSVGEAVLARAPVAVAFVLDDVHVLPDDSGGADLLARLLDHLPTTGHLVLAGRRKPALSLARLVAHGEAVVVREEELAFSTDELASFAGLRGLPPEQAHGLAPWPALAELTASAGPATVRDYVWEEVLAAMPAARRRQLAGLAAIGGGDPELVRAAVGAVDLDELVAEVPLVSSTASGWVELHGLWDEHLAGELDLAERRRIQGDAAAELRRRGDRVRAFPLLADAGDTTELAALVVDVGSHVYLPVAPDVLATWLPVVDDLLGPSAPETHLLRGLLAKEHAGELGTAMLLLEQAIAGLAARGHTAGELAGLVHLFSIGFSVDDADLLARTIQRATELADAGHADAVPIAAIGAAGVADFLSDFAGALELLDTAPLAASGEWTAIRAWMRAELLECLGHPVAALETIESCGWTQGGLIGDQLDGARVQALWSAGRVEDALARGRPAVGRSGSSGSARTAQRAHALAARYEAHLGDAEAADRHLAAVDRHPPADRVIARRRDVARAVRRVLAGDEAGAAAELSWLVEDGVVNEFLVGHKTVRRALPLVYLLRPETRPFWDGAELGPTFAHWRTLAAALAAVRERGDLGSVAALDSIDTGAARAGLVLPWLVELAAALEAADRPEGRELLAAAGAVGHPFLAALAEGGTLAAPARRLLNEVPRPPSEGVEIRLLGPPEVLRGGAVDNGPAWRRGRVRELLAFLVLHPVTTREVAADALWPDLDADAAANNLRGTLSHLLGVLQPDRRGREPSYFVRLTEGSMVLTGADRLTVDLRELERHLDEAARAEGAGAPSTALAAYRRALALWRGPFAGGASWPWAEPEVERLTSRFAGAAGRAAALTLADGDAAEAERLAAVVLDLDPWSEAAHRVAATAQLERGDRTGARRTLERCRAVLDELGVAPEPATLMVERRLTLGSDEPGA
jgi:DNA-binding SARP family transcriptional activator